MKKFHLASFVLGIVVAALFVSLTSPAFATLAGKTIEVFTGVNVYVDDQLIEPKDVNGNPVEVFIYNGTTYLPIRAIGNALGKPVDWDGSTYSAYVGKHASDRPAVMLADMDYFTGYENIETKASDTDNFGQTHYSCITNDFDRSYILNGQYSKMTGTLYLPYDLRSETIHKDATSLNVYGDGKLIYSFTIPEDAVGFTPVDFDIDLTGILKLDISFYDGGFSWNYGNGSRKPRALAIGDCGLWTGRNVNAPYDYI